MKPILFEKDTLDYSNNGIGVLYDVIRLEVEEERNGYFGLEMEYPVDGEWFKELKDQRLILAKPNDVDEPHVFRIYEIDKDLEDGVVYILANSITDDLSGNLVVDGVVEDATAQIALNEIKTNLIEPTHFDFVSDIQTKSSSSWTRINPLQAIAGVRGSLVDLWGGEIKRTNKTLYLFSRRGKDKVTTIRPGKNIDGFNMVVSTKGMVTRILPFFEYSFQGLTQYEMVRDYDGNLVKQAKYSTNVSEAETTTVIGDVVVSDLADKYPVNYHRPVDFSNDEDLINKVEEFINDKEEEIEKSSTIVDTTYFEDELKDYVKDLVDDRASRYFIYDNPGADKPNVKINVDILQLSDSPEWEKYKRLEHIQLTDTVDVYIRKFDVDVEVTISSIVYDSIGERVVSITAGNIQTSLSDSIKKEYENTNLKMEQYYNSMVNGIQNTIMRTADGLNNKFTGYTEPPADISSEGDLWFKIVGPGEIEIYIYNGGRWVAQVSDAVLESMRQDVEKSLQDAEEAFEKANKATEDAEEAIGKAQEGFDKAQQAITDAGKADSKAEKALGDILEVETKAQQALDDSKEAFDKAKENTTLIEDFSVRLGKNEDNYTTITGTVEGLEVEVGKKVDNTTYNSKMTQLDNLMSTMITEEDADGRYTKMTTFTQTVDSMQSDITKKVDNTTYNSKMTQLDNLMQTMITEEDAEGRFTKQTTFNQFADSFSTRVEEIEGWEFGGRNLISIDNVINRNSKSFTKDGYTISFTHITSYEGFSIKHIRDVTVIDEPYILSFKIKKNSGTLERIGAHVDTQIWIKEWYVDGKRTNTSFNHSFADPSLNDGNWHTIEVHFVRHTDVAGDGTGTTNRITPQPNRGSTTEVNVSVKDIQIERGNKATDWSPAPEDTDKKFSAINQTVDSIATRVQTTEKNYSSISQTVSGVQTRVSNAEGNIATVTTLANTNQTKIQNAEGKITTLTQTATSLTSKIESIEDWEFGGRNLILDSEEPILENEYLVKEYKLSTDLVEGQKYTISITGMFLTNEKPNSRFGVWMNGGYIKLGDMKVVNDEGWLHSLTFVARKPSSGNERKIRIYQLPNSELSTVATAQAKLEKGNVRTDWSPAPEDKADTSYVSSQISQLQTAINLRVTKNDVVNQLNIDTSGVLISGKKITLDGDTTVLGTFKVSNANILSGLTASKITTGTLNAANVAITNLNVNRLVGNMATFISSGFNSISSQVSITSTGLTTYSGGSRTSLVNGHGHTFYRSGYEIGSIGTSSWVGDSSYRGLTFNLENRADYMAWAYKRTASDTAYTTMLSWHKTGTKTNKGIHMSDSVHFYDDIFLGDSIATKSSSGYRVVRIRNETFEGVDGVAFRRGRTGGGGLFVTETQARLTAPISSGSSTHASLRVVGSTSSSYVESIDIYNRTYTASSQAMRVTTNGILGRITSSRRYKLLEKPIELEDARKILTVKMKSWYDKQAVEDYAEALTSGSETEDIETISRIGGFIVEDIHDAGLGMFVSYDEFGRPEGLHTNIAYLAFPLLQDHEDRLDYLERKVQIQQDIIDDLMIKNASY